MLEIENVVYVQV